MFFGGITQNKGVQVFKDVHAANPNAQAVRPGRRRRVAVHVEAQRAACRSMTYITDPTLDPKLYPPAGQEFFATTSEVRQGPGAVRDLRLRGDGGRPADAIKRAGDKGNDRQAVIDAVLRDEGPRLGARQVLDRRERRHHALRLRRREGRGRQARVRQGHQGQAPAEQDATLGGGPARVRPAAVSRPRRTRWKPHRSAEPLPGAQPTRPRGVGLATTSSGCCSAAVLVYYLVQDFTQTSTTSRRASRTARSGR